MFLEKLARSLGGNEDEAIYEALIEAGIEKVAEDNDFIEAIEKVAHYSGYQPDEIVSLLSHYSEELEKVAAVDALADSLSEEELFYLLKEAAENDPAIARALLEAEDEVENGDIAKIAELVDSLSDEEAEALLAEVYQG